MPTLKIKNKLGEFINAGAECCVFEYGNDKVIKIFPTKAQAQNALGRQRTAFEHGLAPAVYSKRPRFIFKENGFGIIVERVKMVNSSNALFKEYKELQASLDEVFGHFCDLNSRNLGWSKDGKLICVDFGNFSMP